MGALLWVAKMLLKVMKPFVKIAIIESLIEALEGYVKEQPEEIEEETTTELIIE